jgi:hypothetical protein
MVSHTTVENLDEDSRGIGQHATVMPFREEHGSRENTYQQSAVAVSRIGSNMNYCLAQVVAEGKAFWGWLTAEC